ncbi:MAG: DEAD/DEAH box helicase [Proteobacteria bacterium]|nr:DEAD/DEAH box helicase [Pseudomonadota bacterium]
MSSLPPVFSSAARLWFGESFSEPTEVQRGGWERISSGAHSLLLAPTGSGKTLAAFLWCIDRLGREPRREGGVRVLYVSPLKALAYDVERNLKQPLEGIRNAAERLGESFEAPSLAVRTGDTHPRERRRQLREPGEILVTTPESLYLLLGSRARETLRGVETLIVDEVHALAAEKRGAHLALSLERLAALGGTDPQRIGLSATARPPEEVARFLGGDRAVSIVDASRRPELDLRVVVPLPDMTRPAVPESEAAAASPPPVPSVWPAIYPALLAEIRAHRSTIVFVNSRGLCERLCGQLNELAGEELVRAHHGSLARERREQIEGQLGRGELRGIVATSSLELGIDMSAVDRVLLVESPGSVGRGLQRVGRSGHGVGEVSSGRIFPKHRGDLLEAAVVARGMDDGAIEALRVPENPLDVLAQQVVAMCSVRPWPRADLARLVRRSASFRELSDEALGGVLDMLAGRYPSTEFSELKPRLVWNRGRDVLSGRPGAGRVALVSGGTIPDRGLYAVHLGPDGPRIGELDEEMVHETRPGQTIALGASTWRVLEITRDRVIVTPAPGEPGRLPFWRGEGPGRPIELGRALGAFVREIGALERGEAETRLMRDYRLDAWAARNLLDYLDEQRSVAGHLPSDRRIGVERYRDELGDWRVCILSPFGARLHAPWALAIEARLERQAGFELQALWSDDGIVLRCSGDRTPPGLEDLIPAPEDAEDRVVEQLAHSALFSSRFRENAARALLLPRRRPGSRTPLWVQRLRAQNLLAVARRFASFPILLETYRECLRDVFDMPGLIELLGQIRDGRVSVESVETSAASPFARSLEFAYTAQYLYQGDLPLAERRAQALALDRSLLRELLGGEELRELLDPEVVQATRAELQRTAPGFRARDAEGVCDLLRRLGDLSLAELRERSASDPGPWLEELSRERRIAAVNLAAETRWIAAEDAGLYRDALGAVPPAGLPAALLEPVDDALDQLLQRAARTRVPFSTAELAGRYALESERLESALAGFEAQGRLQAGEFLPGGREREWCDPEVLRRLRRRSLARLRREVAPVDGAVLARFLTRWQRVGGADRGTGGLDEALVQLEGAAVSFAELERSLLPARVRGFEPRQLDELGASGQLVWIGRGALGRRDGKVALYRRERVALLADPPDPPEELAPLERAVVECLRARGACFAAELSAGCGRPGETELMEALWNLGWAGWGTNDTFAPLRALRTRGRARPRTRRRPRPAPALGRWSLVEALLADPPSSTERAHARALALLDRYGLVSREAAQAENLGGGFSSLYPVYRTMEESGKLRRGYFAEGLTGAQFAFAGAVDRLREARPEPVADREPEVCVLSAIDPANPYGALLEWPAPTVAGATLPRRAPAAGPVPGPPRPARRELRGRIGLARPGRGRPPAARSFRRPRPAVVAAGPDRRRAGGRVRPRPALHRSGIPPRLQGPGPGALRIRLTAGPDSGPALAPALRLA